jgi:hypothetical protein
VSCLAFGGMRDLSRTECHLGVGSVLGGSVLVEGKFTHAPEYSRGYRSSEHLRRYRTHRH